MPASGVRCTMVIKDDRFGITETHVYNGGSIESARAPFIQLFKARMKLCGPPAAPYRGRMSLIGAKRSTKLLSSTDIAFIGPAKAMNLGSPTGDLGANDSDQPKAAVQLRFEGETYGIRQSYLAGIPDLVIRENPEGPAIGFIPAFSADLNAYMNLLVTSPWGYIGRAPQTGALAPQTAVAARNRAGDALFGVVLTAGGTVYAQSQKVQLLGWQMSNPNYLSPNGIHEVDFVETDSPVAGQNTVWIRGTVGVSAAVVRTYGMVQAVDFTFIKYFTISPIGQTTRKRGNRSLATPGRRTRRIKVAL